ncbi:hypothetical protein Salat_2610800 [Sesamum alatum]|uniref:Uncharacterized protein n=1 Tax=Sesamum alatum TaxID=300844 RepID=A0AAE2CAI3_9LAMI|nr:hypothetical protein Salat_2610800 [Sesamum alatum]
MLQPTTVLSRASNDEQAVFSNTTVYPENSGKGTVAPKPITHVELKPLPSTLRYEFLEPNSTYPVIVNAKLNESETSQLLELYPNDAHHDTTARPCFRTPPCYFSSSIFT